MPMAFCKSLVNLHQPLKWLASKSVMPTAFMRMKLNILVICNQRTRIMKSLK